MQEHLLCEIILKSPGPTNVTINPLLGMFCTPIMAWSSLNCNDSGLFNNEVNSLLGPAAHTCGKGTLPESVKIKKESHYSDIQLFW